MCKYVKSANVNYHWSEMKGNPENAFQQNAECLPKIL